MLYIFSTTSEQLQQYLLTTKIVSKHFYSCINKFKRISKTELVPTNNLPPAVSSHSSCVPTGHHELP